MTILEINENQLQVDDVKISDHAILFQMSDGRKIEAPLWWYPRLQSATAKQRKCWKILPFGDAVGWEEIDEYISAKALIVGGAAPGAIEPVEAAE